MTSLPFFIIAPGTNGSIPPMPDLSALDFHKSGNKKVIFSVSLTYLFR
jgi:hypothetical protein